MSRTMPSRTPLLCHTARTPAAPHWRRPPMPETRNTQTDSSSICRWLRPAPTPSPAPPAALSRSRHTSAPGGKPCMRRWLRWPRSGSSCCRTRTRSSCSVPRRPWWRTWASIRRSFRARLPRLPRGRCWQGMPRTGPCSPPPCRSPDYMLCRRRTGPPYTRSLSRTAGIPAALPLLHSACPHLLATRSTPMDSSRA